MKEDQKVAFRNLDSNAIYIKIGNVIERLETHEIDWVQSDGNYSNIIARDRKFVVKKSLVKIMDILPSHKFIRIHMRYIVALNKIGRIDLGKNIVKVNNTDLAIGPRYRSDLLNTINLV